MFRKIFLFAALVVLSSCASAPAGIALELPAKNKNSKCNYLSYVGQPVDVLTEKLTKEKKTFRAIKPDEPVTMDYFEDRVNVVYNPSSKKIERVFCG